MLSANTTGRPASTAVGDRAKQFAVKTRIEGTPAIVVNGKYTVPVDQQGFGKMLNTVDWLVAKERGGAN